MLSDLIDGFWQLAGTRSILLVAIGTGVLLFVAGIGWQLSEKTVAASRIEATRHRRTLPQTAGAFASDGLEPQGVAGVFMPADEAERLQVVQALARAGFRGQGAVWGFYLCRILLGLGLPVLFLLAVAFAGTPYAPEWMVKALVGLPGIRMLQWLVVLGGLGFFGPSLWLDSRIKSRKRRIQEAVPNMLDLLQVGVEAGLGFDQAFIKVAEEIQLSSPELAEEMLIMQGEIQAGRDRDKAIYGMARRIGLDEMLSFANVVMQSAKFGTPLSQALTTYAEEMRYAREMRAQEMANKLPVQMSAVMASLMLPALIALILTPIVIRWLAAFGS